MAESEEDLKPLDESESGEWKSWLKAQHSENEDHDLWSHHFMGNRWGNSGNSVRLYFGGAPKSLQMATAAMKLKTLTPWKKSYDQPRQHIQKQRHYFADYGPSSQGCGFSCGHVRMWELDCGEGWAPKKLMLWNCGAGEDSWESLGLQGDPTSPFWRRSALGFLWKDWC